MNYKLRLKHPSGAEFEAEGPAEFIYAEKASFLANMNPGATATTQDKRPPATQEKAFWDKIIERRRDLPALRIKSPDISAVEAVLIIMAAERATSPREEISAITLSKALKISGYEPDRLDRLLSREIKEGRITASGSKRNRTYQITPKGLERAFPTINRLANS